MEIKRLLFQQLRTLFLMTDEAQSVLERGKYPETAEEKAVYAISGFPNKYFKDRINPLNSVMYCNFLYWLSRLLFADGHNTLADKVYYLNKTLNGVDLFYGIELPEIWSCEHPLGTVMGRANYGNRFFFYQGCTVGGSYRRGGALRYPTIGEDVLMYSNSKVLGESHIGSNVTIAANAYIINETIPDHCIVFGQSPNLIIKEKTPDVAGEGG